MDDISQVSFTIKDFNFAERQLDIVYSDGNWAKIQLKAPLPKNQEDLENIVKQFCPPLEVVQAKQSDVDLSFINDLVGKSITISRHSLDGSTVTPDGRIVNKPIEVMPDAETMAQIQKNQEIQNKHGFAQMLVDLGVLKENPVDLSQIVDVTQKLADSVAQPVSIGTITI